MKHKLLLAALSLFCFAATVAEQSHDRIITHFTTNRKLIAFTFDACESKDPMHFDTCIVSYITSRKLPVTIFLSGRFARRNAGMVRKLARYPFIEFENHSLNHFQHMQRLPREKIISEVEENQALIQKLTGRAPLFFRFPAGNYDERALHTVDSLGLQVVHWSFPSGDPDKSIPEDRLIRETVRQAAPGDILIFHINRRGWHTADALPTICDSLEKKGFTFVKLETVLRDETPVNSVLTKHENQGR